MSQNDTIAAISTPLGEGGIGIVRLSGNEAVAISEKILKTAKGDTLGDAPSHHIRLAYAADPMSGRIVDEVLVSVMRAPHTYTREDVVEINCHGGIVAVQAVLEAAVDAGARIAEPGEFTKRAFLNGRIDLAQAEAVIDVIRSKTKEGLRIAMRQLEGGTSKEIAEIRAVVLDVLVELEASVDFEEDDLEIMPVGEILEKTVGARERLEGLIESAATGKIYKEGVKVAIVGRPNVGKSSLLNALVRDMRAIVTAVPGTTRDVIEEVVSLKGVPFRLRDTAGIRRPGDEVEEIGVSLSRKEIRGADLVLIVLAGSEILADEDMQIAEAAKGRKAIVVLNKIDLPQRTGEEQITEKIGAQIVRVCAVNGEGPERLEAGMLESVLSGEINLDASAVVASTRQKKALEKARNDLLEGEACLRKGVSAEFVSTLMEDAIDALGEMTGENVKEDILGQIFGKFCIGK